MVQEARLTETPSGLSPATGGWFVVNVADTAWITHPTFGAGCVFESREASFRQLGINVQVLQPGEPNCLYHSESVEENMLVLAGECVLLVEGEARPLKAWDFVHCAPGTEHVFVGAGDGPCVILMTGVRPEVEQLLYPVSELAQKYGASAERETADPAEAYAPFGRSQPGRPSSWAELPWSKR